LLERIFKLTENQTTIRRELLAGLTTFMTMAYIIVVNPRMLADAGCRSKGVLFATCISAAVATLVMGVWANYPIALAPRDVPECLFHLHDRPRPWRPLADGAGRRVHFRMPLPGPHADQRSRANREWNTGLLEARHGSGDRFIYRIRRNAKRKDNRCKPRHVRHSGQFRRPLQFRLPRLDCFLPRF
jgi:hypothetical protein